MEETGIVERLKENGYALVRARNPEFFERSKCGGACHTFGGGSQRIITAINQGGAKVGDQVLMSISSGAFLKASLIVYLLPVLALLFGAALGEVCGTRIWCSENPEGCAALVAFVCFGLSFGIVRLLNGRASRNHDYYPVIEKVIQYPDPSLSGYRGRG